MLSLQLTFLLLSGQMRSHELPSGISWRARSPFIGLFILIKDSLVLLVILPNSSD